MFSLFKKNPSDSACRWVKPAILAAADNNISPQLFVALILNESSGDPFATRWERKFYIRYIADKPLEQLTRSNLRELDNYEDQLFRQCLAYSWGLCQIMGVVAFEHGFRGRNIWELLDVETNVRLGAQIYAHKREGVRQKNPTANDAERDRLTLLAYNGGGDPDYANRVMKRLSAATNLVTRCA